MQTAAGTLRERLFTMRMSDEEWTRADALAKHYGLNLAGVIRMILKERARELGVEATLSAAMVENAAVRANASHDAHAVKAPPKASRPRMKAVVAKSDPKPKKR